VLNFERLPMSSGSSCRLLKLHCTRKGAQSDLWAEYFFKCWQHEPILTVKASTFHSRFKTLMHNHTFLASGVPLSKVISRILSSIHCHLAKNSRYRMAHIVAHGIQRTQLYAVVRSKDNFDACATWKLGGSHTLDTALLVLRISPSPLGESSILHAARISHKESETGRAAGFESRMSYLLRNRRENQPSSHSPDSSLILLTWPQRCQYAETE
jgi:hypothetical protein